MPEEDEIDLEAIQQGANNIAQQGGHEEVTVWIDLKTGDTTVTTQPQPEEKPSVEPDKEIVA